MNALRLSSILAIALLLVLSATVLPALGSLDADRGDYTEILVKFKPGTDVSVIAQVHRQNGGRVVDAIPQIGVQVVEVPASQVANRLASYGSSPFVAYAERNGQGQVAAVPDDPNFGQQWGLTKVQAPQAWDITHGSSSVQIAVLDTGIDQDHPDLAAKIVASANFTTSPTLNDAQAHGSHVAGIAAAITNNATGVAGLGYDSTLMIAKVIRDNGSSLTSWVAQGITWAVDGPDGNPATDDGAEVINMSLVFSSPSSVLEDAVNYAWDHGVVLVAAAGNEGNTIPQYPAAYSNVIAVAATTADDTLASFSSYGNWVDVAAPGDNIYSTVPNDNYGYKDGTSMASPHVAGLAALLFTGVTDVNGNGFRNDEVRNLIESTADDIGVSGIGHGRINAYKAVVTPSAQFSASPLSGPEPLTVDFSENSTSYDGIASWLWDFGDGQTSTEQNPSHQYAQDGVYTVSLSVTESDGDSDTEARAGYIAVSDTGPSAEFSASPLSGGEPLTVSFSDGSTSYDGIASWLWDFGDGQTSTEQNPTHQYAQDGVYTVSLTVTEADGDSDTGTMIDYITVFPTTNWWLIGGIVGGVVGSAVLVLALLVYRRRRRQFSRQ